VPFVPSRFQIKELDSTYRFLDKSDKGYYSSKMSQLQKEYEDLRKAYFQMEDNMNTCLNQQKINEGTLEVGLFPLSARPTKTFFTSREQT